MHYEYIISQLKKIPLNSDFSLHINGNDLTFTHEGTTETVRIESQYLNLDSEAPALSYKHDHAIGFLKQLKETEDCETAFSSPQVLYFDGQGSYLTQGQHILIPLNLNENPKVNKGFYYVDAANAFYPLTLDQAKYFALALSNKEYSMRMDDDHVVFIDEWHTETKTNWSQLQQTFKNIFGLSHIKPLSFDCKYQDFKPIHFDRDFLYNPQSGISIAYSNESGARVVAQGEPVYYPLADDLFNHHTLKNYVETMTITYAGVQSCSFEKYILDQLSTVYYANPLSTIKCTQEQEQEHLKISIKTGSYTFYTYFPHDFLDTMLGLLERYPPTQITKQSIDLEALKQIYHIKKGQQWLKHDDLVFTLGEESQRGQRRQRRQEQRKLFVEIIEQNEQRYLVDHIDKTATSLNEKKSPLSNMASGVWYIAGSRGTQPHKLEIPSALTRKEMRLYLLMLSSKKFIKYSGGVVFEMKNSLFYLPMHDKTAKAFFNMYKDTPLKQVFEMILGIYKDGQEGTSYTITISEKDKSLFAKDEYGNEIKPCSGEVFYAPSASTILPIAIAPLSGMALSCIFVSTGVITMPAFAIALMTATALGTLALQLTIYQSKRIADANDNFTQNPWVSHNAMAFGLAAIAYCTLMANPIAALIAVTAVMTVAPLASMAYQAFNTHGLFHTPKELDQNPQSIELTPLTSDM